MQSKTPDRAIRQMTAGSVYRRVVLFFALSCAFTWFGHLGNLIIESTLWPVPMFPAGPLIAVAVVIASTEGRAGLSAWWTHVRLFRAPASVYGAATFVTATIILVAAAVVALTGTGIDASVLGTLPQVLLVAPLIALLGGPATEEPAFRGFAQRELQRVTSPLVASLWVGLGVLVWHLPVLLGGNIEWPIALAIVAVSVVYAWLYQAGRSVWPLVALHTVVNVLSAEYVRPMFSEYDWAVYSTIFAVGFLLWATILVIRFGPSLGGAQAFDGKAATGSRLLTERELRRAGR